MTTLCMKNIVQTQKIQEEENREKIKKKTNQQINYKRERELRKEGRESLVVSPHARDQSKRVSLKEVSIWDRSRYNPRQAKSYKDKTPYPISHLTMKK